MNVQIGQIGQQIRDQRERGLETRKSNLDFKLDGNVKQDFEGLAQSIADLAAKKWGRQLTNDSFYTSDAQVATASANALTAVLSGFYLKPPTSKFWADGTLITITDRDVHPGDDEIEYGAAGARYHDPDGNDGIVDADESPERAVGVAEELKKATFHEVKDKFIITRRDMARAAKRGFDEFARRGELTRQVHMQHIDNIIRRGNKKNKVHGICNHPNVRRYVATVDWGAANGSVIWDEYRACLRMVFASRTEEGLPEHCVLGPLQFDHIQSEQFGTGLESTLKTWIERHYSGHTLFSDPGMREADSFGGPAALFYTNDPRLVVCHMPYYMRMMTPFDRSPDVIEVEIVSRIAGVQVRDEDTVLVVDGSPVGWEAVIE